MTMTDEMLMAYADGELDAAQRAQVDAAIAQDPRIARRIAAHVALRKTLGAHFDPMLDEPVPQRLIAAARAAPGSSEGARVVPLRRRASKPQPWLQWGSLAASFALGAIVWHFGAALFAGGPVSQRAGHIVASGFLAQALSTQLAITPSEQSPVRIGVSFRAKGGEFCRTFQVSGRDALAGLACREQQDWRLQLLMHDAASAAGPNGYRQAASGLPPALAQAVDESIAGEPLDAQGEAAARAHDWRP